MKYTAAAPNSAPIPTAPVCIGAAPALLVDDAAGVCPGAFAEVAPALRLVVALGWPEVNGAADADEAPEKAAAPDMAEGLAMVPLAGFRTL